MSVRMQNEKILWDDWKLRGSLSMTPEEYFENLELTRDMCLVLNKLSPTNKLVLERRFFEHKTFKEIASELGVSIARARERMCIALRQLKRPAGHRYLNDYRHNKTHCDGRKVTT